MYEEMKQQVDNKEQFFKGQSPIEKDKSKLRLIKPIFLKESAFAYDLWEFRYNPSLKKYELNSLYHEGMREFINSKNFHKRQLSKNHIYIKQELNIIDETTSDLVNNEIRGYVDSFNENIEFEYNGKYSIPHETLRNVYLKQYHNIVNSKWLSNIQQHDTPILKDTETSSYFVFNNCYLEITKDEISNKSLEDLNGYCVWKEQMIDGDFEYIENRQGNEGEFEKFIYNVCNKEDERVKALKSAIGYLLHNYFNPTKGQAIILYDEELTTSKNPSGGTGKSLIASAIKLLRATAKIDGKNYKSDDKFKWSNITPSTQLVWIDETNKKFDFKDLFSCLTDGWQIERKFHDKFDIAPDDSPKVVICSNTILDNRGSSNKRRQFVVELSPHYSSKIITGNETPIPDEHGILFSKDWDNNQWNNFYSFMMDCVKFYLKNGLYDYERKNVEMNLLKQNTCNEFIEYIAETPPPINNLFSTSEQFDIFKTTYLGEDTNIKQRTFTNWIKLYCDAKSLIFEKIGKSNGIPQYQIREQGNSMDIKKGGVNY